MTRETVLARIKAAHAAVADSGGGGSHEGKAPATAELPVLPVPQSFADLTALFVERARQLGVGIEIAVSIDDAAGRVPVWCRQKNVHRVAVWDTPDLAPIVASLRTEGIQILSPDAPLEELATADLGITGAAWGIAETATLVLSSSPTQPRLTSLLPPIHLAVLNAERILPDLPALFTSPGRLPSALTLVTGPSRSADVGLTPVLGAHGPMEVMVFLVGAAAEGAGPPA